MTTAGWLELAFLIGAILVTAPLLGGYMAKVYEPSLGRPRGDRMFSAIERPIYRICRIDPAGDVDIVAGRPLGGLADGRGRQARGDAAEELERRHMRRPPRRLIGLDDRAHEHVS